MITDQILMSTALAVCCVGMVLFCFVQLLFMNIFWRVLVAVKTTNANSAKLDALFGQLDDLEVDFDVTPFLEALFSVGVEILLSLRDGRFSTGEMLRVARRLRAAGVAAIRKPAEDS